MLRHIIISPLICHDVVNLNVPNIDDLLMSGFGYNLNITETAKNSGEVNENLASMTASNFYNVTDRKKET